jgi:hypothetical protein
MPRHHKVHELLDRAELDGLEEFAREPGRTVDEVHEWMQAKGLVIGRTACWNWLANFTIEDRFRASNDVARTLLDAAKEKDTVAISDAATLQLSQMLFEQLSRLQVEGQVQTKELWAASMTIKNLLDSKKKSEDLRQRFDQQMQAVAAKRPDGAITKDDIAEARKAIFGL